MTAVPGSMETAATGLVDTVMLTVALCPSLVAVMTATPVAMPVTSPDGSTLTMPTFELPHATTRPGSAFPVASLASLPASLAFPVHLQKTYSLYHLDLHHYQILKKDFFS